MLPRKNTCMKVNFVSKEAKKEKQIIFRQKEERKERIPIQFFHDYLPKIN